MPLLLAAYFFRRRQPAAFTFCLFFFFENWLYTATYMADARAMVLPLVTTGDPDFVEHDRTTIFSNLGLLRYDTAIGGVVRGLGWVGMRAVWFGSASEAHRCGGLLWATPGTWPSLGADKNYLSIGCNV